MEYRILDQTLVFWCFQWATNESKQEVQRAQQNFIELYKIPD